MSESVILCEGFHDRAFWDGWLTFLGCNSDGFKPGTPGYPALDPWGDPVRQGQFAFRSQSGKFVRVRPCSGRGNVLQEARIRLNRRTTRQLLRLVINVDVDTTAAGMTAGPTGLRQQDVLYQVQQIDPLAFVNADHEIEVDGGATKVSLVRWEVSDWNGSPAPPWLRPTRRGPPRCRTGWTRGPFRRGPTRKSTPGPTWPVGTLNTAARPSTRTCGMRPPW
jgi:hypothetical protein